MSLKDLSARIKNKEAQLAVIGLGYVGLPVACRFAQVGFHVVGVDILAERVECINAGESPIKGNEPGLEELLAEVTSTGRLHATTDYEQLKSCDVILIDVETPVDDQHQPLYHALRSCLTSLGPVLKDGALVIVESTISPGTMQNIVKPLLEKNSGKRLNEGFYLGNCPERVMPGKLLENLRTLSRVVGGMQPETTEAMMLLYSHIVEGELDPTDCITAELVKTVENAYRDVQIAFSNEIAILSEAVGGDVWKVRELVNKSPGRHMLLPGAGVGGHCIPKDPWLLVHAVNGKEVKATLIPTARSINDGMPYHVMKILKASLRAQGRTLEGSRVLVMGYAYLENSDDTRNSPSGVLVGLLQANGAVCIVHDPMVDSYKGNLLEKATGCTAAVLLVKHAEYSHLEFEKLRTAMALPILVDCRGVFHHKEMENLGFYYRKLGTGPQEEEAR